MLSYEIEFLKIVKRVDVYLIIYYNESIVYHLESESGCLKILPKYYIRFDNLKTLFILRSLFDIKLKE